MIFYNIFRGVRLPRCFGACLEDKIPVGTIGSNPILTLHTNLFLLVFMAHRSNYKSGSNSSITLRIAAVLFVLVFFLIFIAVLYFFYELYQDNIYISTPAIDDCGGVGSAKYTDKETHYSPNEIKLTDGSKAETKNDKEEIDPEDNSTEIELYIALGVYHLWLVAWMIYDIYIV